MNYPCYPEYKPSDIEWLGEVPAHWGLKRLKFAAACINDKQDALPEGLEYVAMEHIESWTGKRLETENGVTPESQTNRFSRGDVLFGKLRPYLAKAWLADRDGVCSTELLVLRERDLEPAYLRYWTLMRSFVEVVDGSTYGSKMPRASWDFIGNVPALIPARDDQRAIAVFLDRETARIDALIARKQRLIKLLAEKRTALISQAVTKGLNPDAPMKDSGIEWLGEIPAHWEAVQLGRKIRLQRGVDISKDKQIDGPYPVVSSGGIESYHSDYICKGPGVIVGRKGTAGKVQFVESSYWPHDTTLYVIEFYGNHERYVYYKLLSMKLESYDTGSANPTINRNLLHPVRVAWPPLAEQIQIAGYLMAVEGQTTSVSTNISKAIETLQEYRVALIANAITGKIDVRSFVEEKEVA